MNNSDGCDSVHATVCDTADGLRIASVLFNSYRAHYGESGAEDYRTYEWLSEMVRTGKFKLFLATIDGRAVGLATSHEIPASLTMRTLWQIRDLYVLPEGRRQGAARALIRVVRATAERAGATRLSLVTEPDNSGALALYDSLGFKPVDGLISLSLRLE